MATKRTKYVLVGNKQRGNKTGKIVLDADRTAVLNGAPVALSDAEYERLSQRYEFRAEGEEQERQAAGADTPVDTEAQGDNPEDKTE